MSGRHAIGTVDLQRLPQAAAARPPALDPIAAEAVTAALSAIDTVCERHQLDPRSRALVTVSATGGIAGDIIGETAAKMARPRVIADFVEVVRNHAQRVQWSHESRRAGR